jgi:hypothetical protein
MGKMRCILSVIALIILGSMAWGGQLVISSLPDTIYQTQHTANAVDTIELAGTKISSATSGLVLTGTSGNPLNGWYIKLGTDTIEFATDSLGLDTAYNLDGSIRAVRSHSSTGLRIVGHVGSAAPIYSRNITVEGGTIICKAYNRDDSIASYNNVCLSIGAQDVYVHNTNMIADGWNGKCLIGDGYDVEIDGGTYSSNVTHYTSRCQFDAIMVNFGGTFDPAVANIQPEPYTYNFKIHGVSMSGIPHMGIRYDGGSGTTYGICHIYNNTINVDERNYTYTVPSGTCASAANAYGIGVQYAGPGSTIHDNIITSGTTYGGGRGILFDRMRGTTANPVLVYNNSIDVHEGPCVEYGENSVESHALRIRQGCHHMRIYDNDITITGDNNVATPSYGKSVAAIRYTFETTDTATEHLTGTYNIIENNHFKAKALNSGVTAYGVCFDAVTVLDTTLVFRYNKIESNNILVKYGEINEGAKGITLYKDTLKFFAPLFSPQTYHVGHLCNNFDCSGNIARDNIYQGGASDTNIIISCASQGTMDFGLQKTLLIKVQGNNGLPVTGASVLVTNNYKQTVNRYTTGNGSVSIAPTYWWESRAANDSLGFNNFSIKVKKDKDSTLGTINISAGTLPMTFTLTKTAGDGSWSCDTCNYICGDINSDGRVDLLDMNYLIMALYKDGPPIDDFSIADVDNSGFVNLLDGQYIISFLYRNGPPLYCK